MKIVSYEEAKADRDNKDIYMIDIRSIPMVPIVTMNSLDWEQMKDKGMVFLKTKEPSGNGSSN